MRPTKVIHLISPSVGALQGRCIPRCYPISPERFKRFHRPRKSSRRSRRRGGTSGTMGARRAESGASTEKLPGLRPASSRFTTGKGTMEVDSERPPAASGACGPGEDDEGGAATTGKEGASGPCSLMSWPEQKQAEVHTVAIRPVRRLSGYKTGYNASGYRIPRKKPFATPFCERLYDVGDTGLEPVTPSLSRSRSTYAKTPESRSLSA